MKEWIAYFSQCKYIGEILMKRILVFGMTENPGGVESFLINYYRHMDRNKIQWDFLCNSHKPVAYEDELVSLGGRCFHITARSDNRQKYKQELETVFKEHASEWNAIWVNVCSLANIDYLKVAKKYGIERRIIHSHNSQNMDNWLRGLLHKWNKRQIGEIATDFWACSDGAARWFYNGETLQKAIVIHNAIDVERMRFDEQKRNAIREKYGWTDKYVLGNVGRLHFQKNQTFAIEVFEQFHKTNPKSVLVLVGRGEDEQMLKDKVAKVELNGSVFFVGVQSNIQAWLSAFDLFLFPSRFEGLGIAALEAQVNGLTTISSKKVIPEEVKMNDNFYFFDLEAGAEAWSRQIEEIKSVERVDYREVKDRFVKNGYDIATETGKLEKLLLG